MHKRNTVSFRRRKILRVVGMALMTGTAIQAQIGNESAALEHKGETIMRNATGTFDIQLTPQPSSGQASTPVVNRLTINKHFTGDLEASSTGEMLSVTTEVKGSAGYVAIELVNGSLSGRSGTFVLQHSGLMDRGNPQATIAIVPDSGTGGFIGLKGTMAIRMEAGKHFYDLKYSLPNH